MRTLSGATFGADRLLVDTLPLSEPLYNYCVSFEKNVDISLWAKPALRDSAIKNGRFRTSYKVRAGRDYTIQCSEDMVDWEDRFSITAFGDELDLSFPIDSEAGFYRISIEINIDSNQLGKN